MARDDEYVICPHCGEEHGDAWEWCADEMPHDVHCDGCGQTFKAWAEYNVQYVTTTKLHTDAPPEPRTAGEGEKP